MSDRFFPPPPPKGPSPEPIRAEPTSPRPKVIVTRPDVPAELEFEEHDRRGEKGKPKLTHDEVHALLAIHEAGRPRPLNTPLRRGKRIFVPIGLLCLLAHLLLGDWGWVAEIVLTLGALVWIALPLLRRSDLT